MRRNSHRYQKGLHYGSMLETSIIERGLSHRRHLAEFGRDPARGGKLHACACGPGDQNYPCRIAGRDLGKEPQDSGAMCAGWEWGA